MRSRHILVEFPVFSGYLVHVEVSSDNKKAMAKYPQTKEISHDDITDAMTVHVKNENLSFIFLKYNSSVGTIAHECWHAVNRMMGYMGIELDSETVAYHLGYLTNEVFRFMRGRK